MKLLDRYIIRQFLVTFLFGLLAVLIIFVVIDMMEKLDDFMDANVDTMIVIQYYISFMPEIIKLMTPVAMLLAALFVTGRLSTQNELAAMKSSGISLYRMMVPFLAVSFLVSVLSIYFNGWIVPYANQQKFNIERVYLKKLQQPTARFNVFFQDGRTRLISMGYYDINVRRANNVSIQEFSDTNLTVMTERYDARSMEWLKTVRGDSARSGWVLLNGAERKFESGREQVAFFGRMEIPWLTILPQDIEKKQRTPDEMDYGELRQFIAHQRRAGQDVSRWMVDYYGKVAFPFASFIVVLFGVPFSSNKRRGGVALEFGISVAATFVYLGFMKTSQVFGYNGDLNPLFTAWLANLIFLGAGVVNLVRVQK